MVGNHKDHCRSVLSFGACDCGYDEVKRVSDNILKVGDHEAHCISRVGAYPCNCKARYIGQHTNTLNVASGEPGVHDHTFSATHTFSEQSYQHEAPKTSCECDRRYPTMQGVTEYHGPTCQAGKQVGNGNEPNPNVYKPNHYALFDDIEAIEVIARSMTVEMFKGYCFGNVLKYRLRAGKKTDKANLSQDLDKAAFYVTLFGKYKGYCYDAE